MTLAELNALIDAKVPSGARPKIKAAELRDVLHEMAAFSETGSGFDDAHYLRVDGTHVATGNIQFANNRGLVRGGAALTFQDAAGTNVLFNTDGNFDLTADGHLLLEGTIDTTITGPLLTLFSSETISYAQNQMHLQVEYGGTFDISLDNGDFQSAWIFGDQGKMQVGFLDTNYITVSDKMAGGIIIHNDIGAINMNSGGGLKLTDSRAGAAQKGWEYNADYSANYSARSVIDLAKGEALRDEAKAYADTGLALKVTKAGDTMSGNLLFSGGASVDTTATGGTDTLNIGTTNAEVINIGNASATVNIIGAYVFEYSVNAYVTDKLFTLNKNGGTSTGIGVGFEIEENSVITGYWKTNGTRTGYSMKSPANAGVLDFITIGTDVVLTAGNTGTIATLAGAEAFTNKTYNGLTVTTTTGTLSVTNGKTLGVSNTLTFTGTDGSSVAFGAGGTVAYVANKLSAFAATTSAELAGVISDETGTGALVFANTPTLVTPVLGVASATSINKITITTPTTGSTLTIQDGFTLTVSGNANVSGTNTGDQTFAGLSPLTTKGDLLTFSTVNARLAVGTDGYILTADSTQATGIKWAALPVSSQWTTTGSDIYYAGNVMIGQASAPLSKLHTVDTITTSPRGIMADQYSNTGSSQLNMRAADGNFASPSAVSNTRVLSNLNTWSHDGTAFRNSAAIRVTSVGTIGTNRTPTKIGFYTMTDVTTSVLTLALELDQAQNAAFSANVSYVGSLTTGTLGYSDTGIFSSFQASSNSYQQSILRNSNAGATASADIIVSNDSGTASTFYGDLGMNSSAFTGSGSLNLPNAVYLTSTSGDLVLGSTTSNSIRFVINSGATDALIINTTQKATFANTVEITSLSLLDTTYKTGLDVSTANTLRIGNGFTSITKPVTMRAEDGTTTLPSYSFSNATNYGMLYDSTNSAVGFITAGSQKFRVGATCVFTTNVSAVLISNGDLGSITSQVNNVYVGSISAQNGQTITVLPKTTGGFSVTTASGSIGASGDISFTTGSPTGGNFGSGNINFTLGTPNGTGTKGSVVITGGTLTDGISALSLTSTMPGTITATNNAIKITITGAGSSSFNNNALQVLYNAGYTGSAGTAAGSFVNANVGTGAALLTGTGNAGISAAVTGVTAGYNWGGRYAASSGNLNVGVVGISTTLKNSATNIGGAFFGNNSGTTPIQVGVYAGLNTTDPTFTSAALLVDNSSTTSPIAVMRDNGSAVWTLADGADVTQTGNLIISVVGKGVQIKSGSNARGGNATLVGGTVTVSNTSVTANTLVILTRKTAGGTIGTAITYTLSAGVSFTINSDNPLDTSTFTYYLVELN
jgi:hypothetical protein